MKVLKVNTKTPYNVYVGENILKDCADIITKSSSAEKFLVVTDSGVPKEYAKNVQTSLTQKGKTVHLCVFKEGEKSKNSKTLFYILSALADNGFDRGDCVVAVGGGVVGDVAGLAAALYMRGIDVVQIPTTLLAAIDSSIGGKTAIDLEQGKNLVGAFHQPVAVICDVVTLKTLDRVNLLSGMGEGIKYCLLAGGKLWQDILCFEYNEKENTFYHTKGGAKMPVDMAEFIFACDELKAKIVSADERESSIRRLLNFGHTIGHAMELLADFSIPHGECVAIGMVKILKMFGRNALAKEVENLLARFGMRNNCPYSGEELLNAIRLDKKTVGEKVYLVDVKEPGNPSVELVSFEKLGEML